MAETRGMRAGGADRCRARPLSSASPVGRVAVGAQQQRDVVVRSTILDPEGDRSVGVEAFLVVAQVEGDPPGPG